MLVPQFLPVYLGQLPTPPFLAQLEHLKALSGNLVEWLPPADADAPVDPSVDAVVLPELNRLAYRLVPELDRFRVPILVITSEFGTVSMWDWEIRDYLRRRGVNTMAPTSLEEFRDVCRALSTRKTLRVSTMLAYQDDIDHGKQPDIFKRFYWWEDTCAEDMRRAFGVTVERRSYRELAARAESISESRLRKVRNRTDQTVPMFGLTERAKDDAIRLYLALDDDLDESPGVIAAGINCLNESATSPTTPCLAWNLLFEERGLIWGCEADLTSMITEYLAYQSLRVPVVMTNLYPFLMKNAALKHERIPYFPAVDGPPENHILVAHCGFLGVVPQSFATEWALRAPVLEIVDPNAHAIDARIAKGPTTIIKIASTMDTLVATSAQIVKYEQYSNSDCLNGAILRVEDGYKYVESLPSHHAVLATGDITRRLDVVAGALGISIEHV